MPVVVLVEVQSRLYVAGRMLLVIRFLAVALPRFGALPLGRAGGILYALGAVLSLPAGMAKAFLAGAATTTRAKAVIHAAAWRRRKLGFHAKLIRNHRNLPSLQIGQLQSGPVHPLRQLHSIGCWQLP